MAIFVPVGINVIDYQIEYKSSKNFGNLRSSVKGNDASPFVGAGFSLKLVDNIYLNGEYNYTTINYRKPILENKTRGGNVEIEGKAHINTMKAGISWNFQI